MPYAVRSVTFNAEAISRSRDSGSKAMTSNALACLVKKRQSLIGANSSRKKLEIAFRFSGIDR